MITQGSSFSVINFEFKKSVLIRSIAISDCSIAFFIFISHSSPASISLLSTHLSIGSLIAFKCDTTWSFNSLSLASLYWAIIALKVSSSKSVSSERNKSLASSPSPTVLAESSKNPAEM